jgi:3-oxoacyl-(acyl-carrier-protein) synthase
MECGMDSLAIVGFRNALASSIGEHVTLPDTLVFDYPTISAISSHLIRVLTQTTPKCATVKHPEACPWQQEHVPATRQHRTLVQTRAIVLSAACDAIGSVPEDIALDQPLMEIGMDSLAVVGFRNALASSLEDEVTLQDTLVFDYPTIDAISSHLMRTVSIDVGDAMKKNAGYAVARRAHEDTCALVLSAACDATGIPPSEIPLNQPLMECGMDSLAVVGFRNILEALLGGETTLRDTLVFDFPTVNAIARHLDVSYIDVCPNAEPLGDQTYHSQRFLSARQSNVSVLSSSFNLPLGLSSEVSVYNLLDSGGVAVSNAPLERWDIESHSTRGLTVSARSAIRYGGFVPDIELFDASRFGLSRAEAIAMDPQQRMLLESGYDAFNRAGKTRTDLEGRNVSVYVGIQSTDYGELSVQEPHLRESVYAATSTNHAVASGRISFLLGLRGACMSINTACSSSLVAMHEARLGLLCSLDDDQGDMALVASVNLLLVPEPTIIIARAGMLSPRGRCHTFDERADGYVRAEGCGASVLGRAPGRMQLRGSAVRSDGQSASLTAPNGVAQYDLISYALRAAGAPAMTLGYIETHGTGTALGDPVEVGSLVRIATEHRQPIVLGGIKSSVGHLEPAAGVAGLVAVGIAIRQSIATGNAQLRRLNTRLSSAVSVLHLPCNVCPMARLPSTKPREYGLSSFGYSGTIAHICVQNSEIATKGPDDKSSQMASSTLLDGLRSGTRASKPLRPQRFKVLLHPHPLLHRHKLKYDKDTYCSVVVRDPMFKIFSDYMVAGRVVFPGTGSVEMAIASVYRRAGRVVKQMTVTLSNVQFLRPLVLDRADGSNAFVSIQCTISSGGRFEISTDLGCVASGMLTESSSAATARPHPNLECTREIDIAQWYAQMYRSGLTHGPGFRTLRRAWRGPQSAIGIVTSHADAGYYVHPASAEGMLRLALEHTHNADAGVSAPLAPRLSPLASRLRASAPPRHRFCPLARLA